MSQRVGNAKRKENKAAWRVLVREEMRERETEKKRVRE